MSAPAKRAIVLAGNPNVGKSVVFGALTSIYTPVSNYPGTTVELLESDYRGDRLIDSPGVYGVSDLSAEERVTRDVLLEADVVINVVDANHLERDLFFTMQLLDMGLPLLVFLNMMDEARVNGIRIDTDLLSDLLGVPVLAGAAQTGEGIEDLRHALAEGRARSGYAMRELEPIFSAARADGHTASQAQVCLALEGAEDIEQAAGLHDMLAARVSDLDAVETRERIYVLRRDRVNDIVGHVLKKSLQEANWRTKLSSAMMQPVTGIPMLVVLLGIIWLVIGQWVGTGLVGVLEGGLMNGYWVPFIQRVFVQMGIAHGTVVSAFLVGEYGLLTMVPSYIIGVIFPLVTAFYILLALLEDSGYLPRIAVLTDQLLSKFGLNGRAIIPLILGLGCVTMGTLTTRVLTSKRERMIAIALMAITVPCSAQLAVIAAMMGRVPAIYSFIYVVVILLIFGIVGKLLNAVMPGQSSDLLIDLPPLRAPKLRNVVQKTAHKVVDFLKEVVLFFAAGGVIITLLQVTGALGWIIGAARPLTVGWLHLPAKAATAFVMGFIRRDFAAAGFFDMHLNNAQLLVAMTTITLFVPCLASALVILKERGPRYFLVLFVSSIGTAFLTGGLLMNALNVVGL